MSHESEVSTAFAELAALRDERLTCAGPEHLQLLTSHAKAEQMVTREYAGRALIELQNEAGGIQFPNRLQNRYENGSKNSQETTTSRATNQAQKQGSKQKRREFNSLGTPDAVSLCQNTTKAWARRP